MDDSRPVGSLRLHEACAIVPEMVADEYRGLLADVRAHGVLSPVEILPDGRILDGRHRWRAAVECCFPTLPVRVLSLSEVDAALHIARTALLRRNLNAGQRAAVVLASEEWVGRLRAESEAEANRKRAEAAASRTRDEGGRLTARPLPTTTELWQDEQERRQFPNDQSAAMLPRTGERDRSREQAPTVARVAGVSARTVQDVLTVKERDPALFEKVRSGEVAAHRAARVVRDRDLAQRAPDLPEGVFDVLYADPPWRYEFSETENRAIENQYPTMSLTEIKAIRPPVADDAALFLWATPPKLSESLEVLSAWGFSYRTCAVWDKEIIGMGYWFRQQHELLLVGIKGSFHAPAEADRLPSVIRERRSEHSRKPEIVYDMLERMFPQARLLELFARGNGRPRWASWGNQAA